MKEYERTFQQWKELAERYFEAETTEAEEEALARFLATPAAQGKEFDELRAVMGYTVTGRAIYRATEVLCSSRSNNRHYRTDSYLATVGKNERMCSLYQWRTLHRQGNRSFGSNEINRKSKACFTAGNSARATV